MEGTRISPRLKDQVVFQFENPKEFRVRSFADQSFVREPLKALQELYRFLNSETYLKSKKGCLTGLAVKCYMGGLGEVIYCS